MNYVRDEAGIKLLGKRIKELRQTKGYSQEKMEFESGIILSQIGRIERGEINTSISTIFILARVLEVELSDLFNFTLPPLNNTTLPDSK